MNPPTAHPPGTAGKTRDGRVILRSEHTAASDIEDLMSVPRIAERGLDFAIAIATLQTLDFILYEVRRLRLETEKKP